MGIMITIKTILAICGGISIVGGAIAVIHRWLNPAINLKNKVEELDVANKELTEKLEQLTENTQILCRCVLVLLAGNTDDDSRIAKNELQEFLIKK